MPKIFAIQAFIQFIQDMKSVMTDELSETEFEDIEVQTRFEYELLTDYTDGDLKTLDQENDCDNWFQFSFQFNFIS